MRLKALSVASEPLERAAKVVDFKLFRTELEATLATSDRSKGAPHVFASNVDDERVADLIDRIAAGAVDVIAYTAQVRRLWDVAPQRRMETPLQTISGERWGSRKDEEDYGRVRFEDDWARYYPFSAPEHPAHTVHPAPALKRNRNLGPDR